jgi:hypothetical protein
MIKPSTAPPRGRPSNAPHAPRRKPRGRTRPSRPVRRLYLGPIARMRLRLAMYAALLGSSTLAGCATIATTATTAGAQCAAWRAITYASKHDTAETVRQVRVHNRAGEKIGCWK